MRFPWGVREKTHGSMLSLVISLSFCVRVYAYQVRPLYKITGLGHGVKASGARDVLCTGNRLFRETLPSEIISDKESFSLSVKNFT